MKRRRFVQAFVAAPALLAQQQPPPPGVAPQPASAQPVEPPASQTKIEIAVPDVASEPMLHFFTPQQFAALRKLSDVLMPGALEAKAPEFLDFLIGHSPTDRQQIYRAGLDALNEKRFVELGPSETDALLSPLREPWTYDPPTDPLARFLREAKQDVRTATVNSREYSARVPSAGRRFGGSGLYWYPLD